MLVIERIIKTLQKEDFTYQDVVNLIKTQPEILKREKQVMPNEGYQKSLQKDREFIRSLKGKPLNLEKSIQHFEKTKKLIPNYSQTLGKSYLRFSVGAIPLFVKEGKGAYLKDLDGNTYIDYGMGSGSCILGYAFDPVVEEVKNQLYKGSVYTLPHYLEYELAEILTQVIPCAEMVVFGRSGSDATSVAIRVARAYTKRDIVVTCGDHGLQDRYMATIAKDEGIQEEVKKITLTFEYNDIESLKRLFEEYPNRIACVIMEPVGLEEPRGDFLGKVRELTHKNGALLIFNELLTGFRFSLGGAGEYFGVIPDIACFGKAMGNGMPVSAVAGKKEVMELFDEVFLPFTSGVDALSIASSIATINYMRENRVIDLLWRQGRKLKEGILNLIEDKEIDDIVYVKGYPVGFIVDFYGEDSFKLRTLFQEECAKRGVLFSGLHYISLAHTDEVIQKTLEVYDEVFDILKFAVEYGMVDELIEKQIIKPDLGKV